MESLSHLNSTGIPLHVLAYSVRHLANKQKTKYKHEINHTTCDLEKYFISHLSYYTSWKYCLLDIYHVSLVPFAEKFVVGLNIPLTYQCSFPKLANEYHSYPSNIWGEIIFVPLNRKKLHPMKHNVERSIAVYPVRSRSIFWYYWPIKR
jgi:hypothetical protein